MGKRVQKYSNSDINQSYTISSSVLLPSTLSYTRDSRKDKNKQNGNGNNMTERPLGRKD